MTDNPYLPLRSQLLGLDPDAAGLPRLAGQVWGVLFEIGYDNGSVTVVSVADGTTSLYTSSGGGMIGAGEHAPVAAATKAFVAAVEAHLDAFGPDPDEAVPAAGMVTFRALTYAGRRRAEAPEQDLGERRHPLWPLFYAGQDVVTQLRLASPDS
jgi:hypothetical protein